MNQVLDLLVDEIAKILGISANEVKSRFSEKELKELLDSSLCDPEGDVGIPFDTVITPCDDLAIPDLLPEVEPVLTVATAAQEKEQNKVKKCIDKVEEANVVIESQIEQYNAHRLLYDKLIEYRDNYFPVYVYYEERAKEAARILNIFEPLIIELRRLETIAIQLDEEYSLKKEAENAALARYNSTLSQVDLNAYNAAVALTTSIIDKINANNRLVNEQNQRIAAEEATIPVFNNENYRNAVRAISNDVTFRSYISALFSDIFSYSQNSVGSQMLTNYAEGLDLAYSNQVPNNYSEVFEKTYFKFRLRFPNFEKVDAQKEKFDKQSGATYVQTTANLINNSPLLQKRSFFQSTNNFFVSEFSLAGRPLPSGDIYTKYYNLFEDPINNFFGLEERGLTTNVNLVDPSLKGTGGETKREKNSQFYIQNIDTLQNFYKEFDARFEIRKEEKRNQTIVPIQESIRFSMSLIAKREVQALLALARVSTFLPQENQPLRSALASFNAQNQYFTQGAADLESEITRIKAKVEELKPDPIKIRKLLKEKSPECFEKIDDPIKDPTDAESDCAGVKSKLGSDPFFLNMTKGVDASLPTQNQLCYWFEFSKLATLVGLLPIPNAIAPPQLRYWPVGLIIPYPGGLIKIPLPIIWIPLVAFSTPLGNIVLFLTINGIFISPVVFFVSSTGFKQHILTLKGPSNKFGYTAEDGMIKPGIQLPLSLVAQNEKANRLSKEATEVETPEIKSQKELEKRHSTWLNAREKAANKNNNDIQKKKVKKQKENFEESKDKSSSSEKFAKAINKLDSAQDAIEKAKKSLLKKVDELGRPPLNKSNKIKEKIAERDQKKLEEKKKALEEGDNKRAAEITEEMKNDGIALAEKVQAIKDDALAYFDRLQFPKIIIPKDRTSIDPKQNAIIDFLLDIQEATSVSGTNILSKSEGKIQKIFSVQLAKHKDKIKKEVAEPDSSDGKMDVKKDASKIKKKLKKITDTIVKAASGELDAGDPAGIQRQIESLKKDIENEKDPAKRAKLQTKLKKAEKRLVDATDNKRTKDMLGITTAALTALAGLSVDFNPFSACCKKKQFALDLNAGPAIAVIQLGKSLLDSKIDSMSSSDLSSLFGGKTTVTTKDITDGFLAFIKRTIPADLEIPLPNLNLATFAAGFTGILAALFEIKVPNLAAQPALPTSIVIDLNILKKPALSLFLNFLQNSLPDANGPSNQDRAKSRNPVKSAPIFALKNNIAKGVVTKLPNASTKTKPDSSFQIVNCEPAPAEDSILSGGNIKGGGASFAPIATTSNSTTRSLTPTITPYNTANVVVNSSKEIHPNFSTLNIDFLNINPADLSSLIKTFIEIIFDSLLDIIKPLYDVLNAIKGLKGININLLEAIQYKIPPYGPPAEAIFLAISNIKKQLPRSATLQVIDTDATAAAALTLQSVLAPIMNTPLPAILVALAGAADAVLPSLKAPEIDTTTGALRTKDLRAASFALRSLHPLVVQDDLPPWERLSAKNLLFLLFLDEFIANGADKIGFFRSFI